MPLFSRVSELGGSEAQGAIGWLIALCFGLWAFFLGHAVGGWWGDGDIGGPGWLGD